MNLLQNIYLFKDLSRVELDQISHISQEKNYKSGDLVFTQGESSAGLYVIRHGSVRIRTTTENGDDLVITQLGTGSHFGELPLVDQDERSATVECLENSQIVEIPYVPLKKYMEEHKDAGLKIYKSLAHFLAGRLRHTTHDFNHFREINLKHF